MADLHEELAALRVDWPETPDLAAAVTALLEAPAPTPARRRRLAWRPALAYGVAIAAAALAVVLAASPDARSAVLEWLGLKSVKIERREPTVRPRPRPPGKLGARLGLGTPVTLAQARARRPFAKLPSAPGLGEPDAVYVGRTSIALVYGRRPGYARLPQTGAALLVQELRAQVTPLIGKSVGEGARLTRLRVGGGRAYFITGTHGFAYDSGGGAVNFENERLAGNTLLVERRDGVLLRVEGQIPLSRAVRIAESVR